MQQVSGLLMRLNFSTRRAHAAVDSPWMELMRADVTRTDYLSQLVRTYGLVAPFEAACKYTPELGRVIDHHHLTRTGSIVSDLLALGLTASQIANAPQCWTITTFDDVPEALGWLYVIERATLLQDGVRRHLVATVPGLAPAASYPSFSDGRISDNWQTFGRTLDRACTTPDSADAVLSAATAGFATAARWFSADAARQIA